LKKSNLAYNSYVVGVTLAALVLLALLSHRVAEFDWSRQSPSNLILWMAMISVAAMSPIPLPRGRSAVTVVPALDLAAILVFGPGIACWFGVLSRFVANTANRWHPLHEATLRWGHAALAIGAAGGVYALLAGTPVPELFDQPVQIAGALFAGLVYLLVKTLLRGVARHLATEASPTQIWRNELAGRLMNDLMVLPLAGLLAFSQVRMGPLGVAFFLIPLLMARYVFRFWIETKRAHIDTVRTLMSAVDANDPFTRGHSNRISKMSLAVAKRLGVPEKDLDELEYAALLHDFGRTALQHDIQIHRGKLSEEAQAEIRSHPKTGHDILRRLRLFEGAADIVFAHHEQPDGRGYPRGLEGDAIPPGSRIIMVVAAFDAMTSDRPYRRGLAPEAALEELLTHSGTQFFPEVVEALIELYSNGELFAEFEAEELESYAEGDSNSRALQSHARRLGRNVSVPDKRGMETAISDRDGVPVIELVAGPEVELILLEHELGGNLRLRAAGLSDIGCVRQNNEDSFGVFREPDSGKGCLLVIADGMGGAAAGEVASRIAVESIREGYFEHPAGDAPESLREAVEEANRRIHSRASTHSEMAGMGTTCTALVVVGREVVHAHVGDSRAYLSRGGQIRLLTQDHTLAAELSRMVPEGMSPEGASNVLTRCLGNRPEVQVEMGTESSELQEGDTLVLCSDGLSNLVGPEEILDAVSAGDPESACRRLIATARDRGGPDNITVIVAETGRS
jgi:putative nucleotidyltransferase with HDIG domain